MSLFVTFEGGDGSGKSTQINLLLKHLHQHKYNVYKTHEPGGTKFGDLLRSALLDAPKKYRFSIDNRAEVLGFCAARAQLVAKVILPKKKKQNSIVLCDRYIDSTMAYQVFGRGKSNLADDVLKILSFATRDIKTDINIYFDISLEESKKRRDKRKGEITTSSGVEQFIESNHFDEKKDIFYQKVSDGYEYMIQNDPERWFRVSGDMPIDKVAKQVQEKIMSLIEERGITPMSKSDIALSRQKEEDKNQLSLFQY